MNCPGRVIEFVTIKGNESTTNDYTGKRCQIKKTLSISEGYDSNLAFVVGWELRQTKNSGSLGKDYPHGSLISRAVRSTVDSLARVPNRLPHDF